MSYLLLHTDGATALVSQVVSEDDAHASLYIGHTEKKPQLRGICSDFSETAITVIEIVVKLVRPLR